MSLKKAEPAKLSELRDYTTIKIGGRAEFFSRVESIDQLGKTLAKLGPSYYLLGNGSNLLVDDSLIKRPVIKLGSGFNYIRSKENYLEVGSATSLASLIGYCLKHNLSGLENLVGIPATVGGLLSLNATAYGGDIASKLSEVCAMDSQGNIVRFKKQDLTFDYRSSSLENYIILWLGLSLSRTDNLKQRLKDFIIKRLSAQDFSLPSCGCVFKNPKLKPAGLLIDSCGLKGLTKGDAQISYKHANFILNRRKAKYQDVDYLIQKIKGEVYKKYSIILEEEIKRWT